MPKIARITIYLIKSLPGCDVDEARVLPSGALEFDRRWALVNEDGDFVNGKRNDQLHQFRSHIHDDLSTVEVRHGQSHAKFHLPSERESASAWFSDALGVRCQLQENVDSGMPDDLDAPGPTIIGAATIGEVAAWFPGLSIEEARRRFRANLEIDADEAFWEDQLAGQPGESPRFSIGDVTFCGRRVCQRCVVPSRDTQTGAKIDRFTSIFTKNRQQTLPPSSPVGQFDHFYRIAINTAFVSHQNGTTIRVGDPVRRVS